MQWVRRIAPRGKKRLLADALQHSGANRLAAVASRWSGVLTLNYHRIGQPAECQFDRNLYSATAEGLERQVRFCQRNADVISVADLGEVLKSRRGKHVLLTFDDGYRDNYDLAFPVLKNNNATAVFFIPTGFIDRPRVAWWDEIAWMLRHATVERIPAGDWFVQEISIDGNNPAGAIGTAVRTYWQLTQDKTDDFLDYLAEATRAGRCPEGEADGLWVTWEMLREMTAAGQDIGGHTVDHPLLAQCSPDRQRAEIFGGRARLVEQLGIEPLAFAYPVGQSHMFTDVTKQLVEEAGFRYAFSFYGGYDSTGAGDPFDLKRAAVEFAQVRSLFDARVAWPQLFARK